jgi:hypothetical protein
MIKRLTTALLLAFVVTSLAYLVVHEIWGGAGSVQPETSAGPSHRVAVYYFRDNLRCDICEKFQAYTDEAIHTAFSNELKSGSVEWKIVNTDDKANSHFVKDYKLTTRQIILSDLVDGKQRQWKDLYKIWDLVKDKRAYVEYITQETKAYLDGVK